MKRTITSKIIISYLAVIFVSFIFIGAFFNFMAKGFIESQVKDNLQDEAARVVGVLRRDGGVLRRDGPFQRREPANAADEKNMQQAVRDALRKDIGLQDSTHIAVTSDFELIFPTSGDEIENFKTQVLPAIKQKFQKPEETSFKITLEGKEYIMMFTPVNSGGKSWIISYTSVGGVQELSKIMLKVLLVTLLLTSVIAVGLGIFIARSIAKPIITLKRRAERLSMRDFDSRVEIHTHDEIEELANTIEKMAVELKEYDTAQKKFLQNASHELKTPLMSIQGYAEGIKDGVFDSDGKALDIIVDESTRLKNIVEEIIYLSKLETMEEFYRFGTESINEVIKDSIEKVDSLAVKNGIRINCQLCKDTEINMDRDKFIQALINILGNCLRYAAGEINIKTVLNAKLLEIIISDDGEGFEESEIKNVFERFYKGKKGNTGLGLTITKIIIEKHGGGIEAKNSANGGAEFRIRLQAG